MRVLELRKLGFRVSPDGASLSEGSRAPVVELAHVPRNHRPVDLHRLLHGAQFHTLYVFFFVAHDRRTVMHVNVTTHPTATWVWRQLINATPWGNSPRFLIRDRDRSYGGDFIERAKRIGIHTVLTPIATPQANGIAERLVGTFRRECLDHIIIVNERHLRYALREFVRTRRSHTRRWISKLPSQGRDRPARHPARLSAARYSAG